MRSWVPGRDFRSSIKNKKKVCGCFMQTSDDFCCWKKMFVLSPFRWRRINTSLNNRMDFMARPTVAKNQGNQFSQYLDINNGRLISSSAYFPWNMTLKYKMKLSEGSWDKILRFYVEDTVFLEGFKNIYIYISGSLSLEAIDQSFGSSFRDFFVKTNNDS